MEETQTEIGTEQALEQQPASEQSIFYHAKPPLWSWLSAAFFTLAGFAELYVWKNTVVAMQADPACLAKAAANTSNPFAATGALCPLHPIGGFGSLTAPIIVVVLVGGGGLWLSYLFYRTILKR